MKTTVNRIFAPDSAASAGVRVRRLQSPLRLSRALARLLTISMACGALGLTVRQAPARASSAVESVGQTKPIGLAVGADSIVGGDPITAGVAVDVTGGSVQVGCDRPDLVASPSSSWPFVLSFPSGGSTIQSVSLATASVSASTVIHIYTCASGLDASDPSNWTSTVAVTLSTVAATQAP